EQRLRLAARGGGEVLELKLVPVGVCHVDPLAVDPQMRVAASPRLRHEHGSRRADRLEPALGREVEPAAELREDVALELEHRRETHVDAGLPDDLPPEHERRLSSDEPGAADAV